MYAGTKVFGYPSHRRPTRNVLFMNQHDACTMLKLSECSSTQLTTLPNETQSMPIHNNVVGLRYGELLGAASPLAADGTSEKSECHAFHSSVNIRL